MIKEEEQLEELSREKIMLLLEIVKVLEGYERKIVIVNKKIYNYKEIEKNYIGAVIKKKKLFPMKEQRYIEDYLERNSAEEFEEAYYRALSNFLASKKFDKPLFNY